MRRYGGYLAHLGFAGLFLGFIGTGLKTEKDLVFNAPGISQSVEDKQLTFKGLTQTQNREYSEWFAEFDVHQLDAEGQPGELLGTLYPSRRSYHGANVKLSRVTTEKDELFLWKGNVYLALISFKPGFKTAEVMAHYNPMILFMWLGGAFLLFGVVVTLWPEAKPYPVFSAATRRRPAAVGEVVAMETGTMRREGVE
jgi:cytochrome c biogenesis factor